MNAVVVVCESCGEAPATCEVDGYALCGPCVIETVEDDEAEQLVADTDESLALRR